MMAEVVFLTENAAHEPELNEGEIQEVAESQVIHELNALGPGNHPLAEAGVMDPIVILCTVAKEHLRGKVNDAIMAEPGSFAADTPCRIKDRILEMNPNNERVQRLIEKVQRGETIELVVDLLYDIAIKQKKPVWKWMTDRLFTCVINQAADAASDALELALCGSGDALPVD